MWIRDIDYLEARKTAKISKITLNCNETSRTLKSAIQDRILGIRDVDNIQSPIVKRTAPKTNVRAFYIN